MPRRRAYGAYGSSTVSGASFDEHDVACIEGMPVDKLTPELVQIFQKLLSDAAALRGQLDAAKHHRRQLEDHADHYPGLPCLNGHAFVRELDAFLREQSTQNAEDFGHLAVIHVGGIEAAVGRWGIEAGEFAVLHIWGILHQRAQQGEPLAYWGFGTFSWLLIGSDAQDRLNIMLENLRQSPPQWQDAFVELHVSSGMAPVLGGKTAEQAVLDAESNRLNLTRTLPPDSVPE